MRELDPDEVEHGASILNQQQVRHSQPSKDYHENYKALISTLAVGNLNASVFIYIERQTKPIPIIVDHDLKHIFLKHRSAEVKATFYVGDLPR